MRAIWPGLYGNVGGSAHVVSKRRKYAVQAARFMVQMIQTPLFSTDLSNNFDITEEGLAIRIAVEVANCPDKKTAGKAYALALCKVAVLLRFRQSEQKAIKCMRGLVNSLVASAASDLDLVKELTQMASRLGSLDECTEEELPGDQADTIFNSDKLGLDGGFKFDSNQVVPPTPAPRAVQAAPARRRTKREPSSSDDSDAEGEEENLNVTSVSRVPATPSMTAACSRRASKTAAVTKMSAKPTVASSDSESDDQSNVTTDEDPSDEESSSSS